MPAFIIISAGRVGDYQQAVLYFLHVNYWRSQSGFEVDFIIANKTAIEVKGSKTIGSHDLKGLNALMEEKHFKKYILVCFEKVPRKVGAIEILPWNIFLTKLWSGEYTQ